MPIITYLEVLELRQAPLFSILRQCPLLRQVHLGSEKGHISSTINEETNAPYLAQISALTLGPFGKRDFSTDRVLARFVERAGGHISSLNLMCYNKEVLPSSFSFLLPFPHFTANITNLFIGKPLFYKIGELASTPFS
jgi:hypothetical protein